MLTITATGRRVRSLAARKCRTRSETTAEVFFKGGDQRIPCAGRKVALETGLLATAINLKKLVRILQKQVEERIKTALCSIWATSLGQFPVIRLA
ncbi:MAG: hypothetical protein IPP83_04725 [Flavobacteriales bacterium]|nr:hypothetical protein [Flavobacteriales bacterium]